MKLSPRWVAAKVKKADVEVGYAVSESGIKYNFLLEEGMISLTVSAEKCEVQFHVLLPENHRAEQVIIDNKTIAVENHKIEKSNYADFEFFINGNKTIQIKLYKE